MRKQIVAGLVAGFMLAPIMASQSTAVEDPAKPMAGSGTAFEQGQMSMNIVAGYALLSMKAANTALADFQEFYLQFYDYDDTERLTKVSGAFHGGVELDFEVSPGLKIGPRLDILQAFPGEVYGLRDDDTSWLYDYEWTITFTGTVIPVTAGLSYTTQSPGNISFTFGANVGVAFASANLNSAYNTDNPSWAVDLYRWDIPVAGNELYANFLAAMNMELSPGFNMFLRVGYRFANFDQLEVTETVRDSFPLGRVNQGERATDFTGQPLELDFSGLDIALGATFGF